MDQNQSLWLINPQICRKFQHYAGVFPNQLNKPTPVITTAVPANCIVLIGSCKIKYPNAMVETGPTNPIIPELLAPTIRMPSTIKKVGITVATTASQPYK